METLQSIINKSIKTKKQTIKLIPIVINGNVNGKPYIKLYQKVCDACNETIRHAWFPLEYILEINSGTYRNTNNCNEPKFNCNSEGIVISISIRSKDNWFSKINKLEIIYI